VNTFELTANGLRFAGLQAGEGGAPLLLVHGFGGSKEDFADHLDTFAARGWHAVSVDHRGHGSSDRPESEDDYSMSLMADDVLAWADSLGWDRFTLLGHSMGGMVVQHVAHKAAERLNGLVLMDTSHGRLSEIDPDSIELGKLVVRQAGVAGLKAAQDAAGGSPLDTPAHKRLLETRPGYREFCDRKAVTMADAMWLGMIDEITGLGSGPAGGCDGKDRLEWLTALDVPTLVIVGEQDRPFIEASRAMAAAIDGATLTVIPDAGHSPQFENPESWLEAMTAFLDQVAAGAR
jgi:3-oxoadipate enol-lactonase